MKSKISKFKIVKKGQWTHKLVVKKAPKLDIRKHRNPRKWA